MSAHIAPTIDDAAAMSAYERQVWRLLNEHWQRRDNKRGLPNWASTALQRTGEVAGSTADRVKDLVPETVKRPLRETSDKVVDFAGRPAIDAAVGLVDLVNEWALELNNPTGVEKLAKKHDIELASFTDLRQHDLKVCDRLLNGDTLKWRTVGVIEGGAMGALALVPIAGLPVALTADILVIQVLSTAIAARIAYSYGYDAQDPEEQIFIERMVRRSFLTQATKIQPLGDVAAAANALKGRVNWSNKLRTDHRLVASLEKLMKQLGPAGSRVPVQNVAKFVPVVGIIVGAGVNSVTLGKVAADARRYCQTRFLCDKYGLPLPAALTMDPEEAADPYLWKQESPSSD